MATLTFMPKKNFEFEKTYKGQREQRLRQRERAIERVGKKKGM